MAVTGDAEAETLIRRLRADGYEVTALVEQEAVGRLATARLALASDPEGPVMDLLFASSGIEQEVVAAAELIELLPGLRVKVAGVAHLIALKVLSRDDVQRTGFTVAESWSPNWSRCWLKPTRLEGPHRGDRAAPRAR